MSFNGQENATQTSTLGGKVSGTIAKVRPNVSALVVGEKLLLLSQGQELVQVSGIVRLDDIDAGSRVRTTQAVVARVTYTGNGLIACAKQLEAQFARLQPTATAAKE